MRYFVFILISSINLYSQEIVEKDSLWTTRGNVAVLLNQTGFSDWVGGGTNNFSGTLKFDYEWEFKDKGWDWLTNVESAFGLAKYKNAPFARKIDDRILDGISLKNTLYLKEKSKREKVIFYRQREIHAIRHGDFKAHFILSGSYNYPKLVIKDFTWL